MGLVEVLLVCVLMIVVLGATLTSFSSFERNNATNQRQNDAQDQARNAMAQIARELRNMASPVDNLPESVNRADAKDLIFLYVGGSKPSGSANARNTRRVRYCLDSTGNVRRQLQTWETSSAPAMPSGTECPASGWSSQRVVASNVVNDSRPVFQYDATELTSISHITAALYVDVNPGQSPSESTLQSGVFLRNQNRKPTASFTAEAAGSQIVLNASESEDPEGKSLDFYWYDTGTSANQCGTLPADVPTGGCIGTGIVFTYTPPASGIRTIRLLVRDPAGLSATVEQTACTGSC